MNKKVIGWIIMIMLGVVAILSMIVTAGVMHTFKFLGLFIGIILISLVVTYVVNMITEDD